MPGIRNPFKRQPRMPEEKPHYVSAYEAHVEAAIAARPLEEAMAEAVGGDFLQFGLLERCVLEQSALRNDAYLIDVGCGSGRLALALRSAARPATGGRLVFSFLDFGVAGHWSHFAAAVGALGTSGPMVAYMDARGIAAWAQRLDCVLVDVFDDDTPFVKVEACLGPIDILPGVSHLGQSVAVYEKRN